MALIKKISQLLQTTDEEAKAQAKATQQTTPLSVGIQSRDADRAKMAGTPNQLLGIQKQLATQIGPEDKEKYTTPIAPTEAEKVRAQLAQRMSEILPKMNQRVLNKVTADLTGTDPGTVSININSNKLLTDLGKDKVPLASGYLKILTDRDTSKVDIGARKAALDGLNLLYGKTLGQEEIASLISNVTDSTLGKEYAKAITDFDSLAMTDEDLKNEGVLPTEISAIKSAVGLKDSDPLTYAKFKEYATALKGQFSDTDNLKSLINDPNVGAALRLDAAKRLRELGQSGTRSTEEKVNDLQQQIIDGDRINAFGREMTVEEALDNENLSNIIIDAFQEGDAGIERLRSQGAAPLADWLERNKEAFNKLAGVVYPTLDVTKQVNVPTTWELTDVADGSTYQDTNYNSKKTLLERANLNLADLELIMNQAKEIYDKEPSDPAIKKNYEDSVAAYNKYKVYEIDPLIKEVDAALAEAQDRRAASKVDSAASTSEFTFTPAELRIPEGTYLLDTENASYNEAQRQTSLAKFSYDNWTKKANEALALYNKYGKLEDLNTYTAYNAAAQTAYSDFIAKQSSEFIVRDRILAAKDKQAQENTRIKAENEARVKAQDPKNIYAKKYEVQQDTIDILSRWGININPSPELKALNDEYYNSKYAVSDDAPPLFKLTQLAQTAYAKPEMVGITNAIADYVNSNPRDSFSSTLLNLPIGTIWNEKTGPASTSIGLREIKARNDLDNYLSSEIKSLDSLSKLDRIFKARNLVKEIVGNSVDLSKFEYKDYVDVLNQYKTDRILGFNVANTEAALSKAKEISGTKKYSEAAKVDSNAVYKAPEAPAAPTPAPAAPPDLSFDPEFINKLKDMSGLLNISPELQSFLDNVTPGGTL